MLKDKYPYYLAGKAVYAARDRLGFPLGENLRDMGRGQDDIDRILGAQASEEAAFGRAARVAFEQGQS